MRGRWIAGLGVLLSLSLASASAAGSLVRFEEGRLRVSARQAPASALFAGVAEATGVRLVIAPALAAAPLTLEIESRDLEEGLRTLLLGLPGVAGHTMSWAPSEDGSLRLVEAAAFGPGGPGVAGTAYGERSDAGAAPEVERKVLDLIRDLERARALPRDGDLSPALRERVRALRDAGFREEDAAVAVFHAERRKRLFEELATIPGGVEAFHRLKVRSYYEPREEDGTLPHFFSDVGDPS